MLMRLIDEQYIKHPEFGVPRMTRWLREGEGHEVNHKPIAGYGVASDHARAAHEQADPGAQNIPVFTA